MTTLRPNTLAAVDEMLDELHSTRRLTLALAELATEDELRAAFHPDISPIGWHLGHIAAFEEMWILGRAHGQPPLSTPLRDLFNPLMNPKNRRTDLPPRDELFRFVHDVRRRVLECLQRDLEAPVTGDPLRSDLYVYGLVAAHEQQHQETISVALRLRPAARREACAHFYRPIAELPQAAAPALEHCLRGGAVQLGEKDRLVGYDNERPGCSVTIGPFAVDARPVTHADWLRFVEEGGYRRRELWTGEGWSWRSRHDIRHPFTWSFDAGTWRFRSMRGDVPLPVSHPVEGVSAYEAEAYARFAGKRLPSEAEWENAARSLPVERPHLGLLSGGTRPVSSSNDLLGNVWEWTSSTFAPYPGFRPEPYEGYSTPWFDGRHRVLRGGSWATQRRIARPAFRNWFEPHWRLFPMGLRCARSL